MPAGPGDLNITLLLVDGPGNSHNDPAFQAHEEPIVKWAEAIWEKWLPTSVLQSIARGAIEAIGDGVVHDQRKTNLNPQQRNFT